MTTPRVLFAGTPEFALASLRALVESGIEPVAVYTQPDRPAGRGKKLTASPVKQYAVERGIQVLQPDTMKDESVAEELAAFEADVLIVAAYGLILPQNVLDIPKHGCLNVHASILPRWRGAAPIQAAILAGDEQTGISLMEMTAGLDCGPVLATRSIEIAANETAGELHDRLASLGGNLLVDSLDEILASKIDAVEQEDAGATYAGKIKTADAMLDWTEPASVLDRKVRAYNPAPGAWFMLGDERIKCWRASVDETCGGSPGTVLAVDDLAIVTACGSGALRLEELQRPGKRPVSAREFALQLDPAGKTLD